MYDTWIKAVLKWEVISYVELERGKRGIYNSCFLPGKKKYDKKGTESMAQLFFKDHWKS